MSDEAATERQSPTTEPRTVGAWPWHPLLFAVVMVLTAWLDAAISPYPLVRPLVAALVVAGVLTLVGSLATRSAQVGGLIASAVLWLLWSRHLLDLAESAIRRLGPLGVVWAVALVLAALIVIRLARRRVRGWTLARWTSVLNRGALLLTVVTVATSVVTGRAGMAINELHQGRPLASLSAQRGDDARPGPDIYAILLDGYPRADVLADAFGIDNSAFLDELGSLGFEVAPRSHSDYLWTHTTLPSVLQMDYIENIPRLDDMVAGRIPLQPATRLAIDDNPTFEVAREKGYTTVSVASGFEHVTARSTDVFVDSGHLNEFEISLLASTFAGDIVNLVAPGLAGAEQAGRIEDNLDALPQIAGETDAPVFVWAHIPAPHQPTVFAADGSPLHVPLTDSFFGDSPIERGEDPDEFRRRYRDQLGYLNRRILATVSEIVGQSSEPPIIVLFADHGSASRVDWVDTQPSEADPALVLERTGTLFAALTPGKADVFPPDVSPVDIFRLLFDAYFGTDFGRAVPPPGGGQIEPVDASVLDD